MQHCRKVFQNEAGHHLPSLIAVLKAIILKSAPVTVGLLLQKEIVDIEGVSESVDSLCRDGADTPIVRVHWKAFLTREYSRFKPFSAREWPIQPILYPMIPHK